MTEEEDYLKKTMRLSDNEVKNAVRFLEKHRCRTTICRSMKIQYTISFCETSIGSFVKIQCGICDKEKEISDEIRSNW